MSGLIARIATYAATGLVSQAAIFLLWLAMPWFLATSEVGFLTLAMFAVEILTMFGTAGMDAALIRFAVKLESRNAAFSVALVVAGIVFLLLSVLAPIGLQAVRWLSPNIAAWVTDHFGLVLMAVVINIAWNLTQSVLIAGRHVNEYAMFQITRSGAQLLFGICAVKFFERDAATVLSAITGATFLVMLLLTRRDKFPSIVGNHFHASDVIPMVHYGLSMLIYGMLGLVTNYTQRLVVDHYTNLTALGVFAFFNVIVLQTNGFWGAVAKAWMPEFFVQAESDRSRALDMLRGMLVLLCVLYPLILAVCIIAGKIYLDDLVFPATYAKHTDIFWLMMLSSLFNGIYSIASPLYYYNLRIRRILAITTFLSIANLATSVLFIRTWGVEGASVSLLLLSMMTAWIYLAFYRDWVDSLLPKLLAAVTTIIGGVAIAQLVTHSIELFVVMLLAAAVFAWMLGEAVVRPLIGKLIKRINFEY